MPGAAETVKPTTDNMAAGAQPNEALAAASPRHTSWLGRVLSVPQRVRATLNMNREQTLPLGAFPSPPRCTIAPHSLGSCYHTCLVRYSSPRALRPRRSGSFRGCPARCCRVAAAVPARCPSDGPPARGNACPHRGRRGPAGWRADASSYEGDQHGGGVCSRILSRSATLLKKNKEKRGFVCDRNGLSSNNIVPPILQLFLFLFFFSSPHRFAHRQRERLRSHEDFRQEEYALCVGCAGAADDVPRYHHTQGVHHMI